MAIYRVGANMDAITLTKAELESWLEKTIRDYQEVQKLYEEKIAFAKKLMQDKNHDYGEAWREMSQESFVDLTLAKILRIKQILKNDGQTIISEGIDANFYDIINYAIFALILIEEKIHRG